MSETHALNGWSKPLAYPLTLRDGTKLETLSDARAIILDRVNDGLANRPSWRSAIAKLIAAAESGKRQDVEAATKQVHLALLMQAWFRPE